MTWCLVLEDLALFQEIKNMRVKSTRNDLEELQECLEETVTSMRNAYSVTGEKEAEEATEPWTRLTRRRRGF